jgi:hypothetical protein
MAMSSKPLNRSLQSFRMLKLGGPIMFNLPFDTDASRRSTSR